MPTIHKAEDADAVDQTGFSETDKKGQENSPPVSETLSNTKEYADESKCDPNTADQNTAAEVSSEDSNAKGWTFQEIKKNWRKFNIDLAPRVS